MSKFVHLHTHSHYSLLDGMNKIPDLVARAKEHGMTSLAVTDHGNVYGAIEFYKEAKKAGIKPILGVEAYVAKGDHKDRVNKGNSEKRSYHLVLLAKNEKGWENLLQLVTLSYLEGFYYKPRMSKDLFRKYSEGLIALSGCLGGELAQALLRDNIEEAEKVVKEYQEIFGKDNYYIELGKHPKITETLKILPMQVELAKKTGAPLVATKDSHYLNADDKETHDILLAIQTGKSVDDPNKFTLVDNFSFVSGEEMEEVYKDLPEAIENTAKIAEKCNVTLELGKVLLPKFDTPGGKDAFEYMEELLKNSLESRYPNPSEEVLERLKYECEVIKKTGFADYFLIVQDFINWAKERNIVVGPGRGSAAGSIVSYILGITDIDPIKYELLFERFLNPDRNQMPDIDIDVTDARRDEVFAYLEEKYGVGHVAHIITFGTMAARAAIRDVGRALDIEYGFCDQLAKLIPFQHNLTKAMESVSELQTLYKTDDRAKRIIDAAKRLEGVARHASVHACGIVVSEEPLVKRVALQFSPQKNDVMITQFEMYSVEDIGLLKIDLLGLKNLTIIENALRTIQKRTGEKIDISSIPLDDPKTFALFQKADTTGVFQLESGGMRRYLKELKATDFEDVIAILALYRPGPMDFIPDFIAGKHGKRKATYLHPKLEPILEKTYGIAVYQEQVLRMARDLAGFTFSEADVLRKAVGKKIKKLLDQQKVKFIEGCIKNGISEIVAQKIFAFIEPFARYGFNRAHSTSYAMIAYRTAWLKANYPVEFMTAVFNADSGDVERMSFLIGESKNMGIQVLPPDINKSSARFITDGKNIRFGLEGVKNVGTAIVSAIVEERVNGGEFKNFTDFISRVKHKDLNKKSLESLIRCGALDNFKIERNTLLNNIDEIIGFIKAVRKEQSSNQSGLFGNDFSFGSSNGALKLKEAPPATSQERLNWEKELLGLYVSEHPLQIASKKIKAAEPTSIEDVLSEKSSVKSYRIAGMITKVKSIITKTGKPMAFVKIEDLTSSIEVVVFSDTFIENQSVWEDGNVIVLVGKLSFRNGETSLIANNVKKL